jgi:hypothetical protein
VGNDRVSARTVWRGFIVHNYGAPVHPWFRNTDCCFVSDYQAIQMTQPRHPKSGKFIKQGSLLAKLASMFKGKPDKAEPALIGHDPNAKEQNTTRSKRK